MTPAEIIEAALLQVADNVAKHLIQRDGWTPDDACFRVDLREAQAKVVAVVEQAVAAQRARIASLLEHSADCMDDGAPRCTDEPQSVSLRKLAAAIRAGG